MLNLWLNYLFCAHLLLVDGVILCLIELIFEDFDDLIEVNFVAYMSWLTWFSVFRKIELSEIISVLDRILIFPPICIVQVIC